MNRFDKLSERFDIKSLDDFFKIIALLKIDIVCADALTFESMANKDKLEILLAFFRALATELDQYDHPYKGTKFKLKAFKKCFPSEKQKMIDSARIEENKSINEELKGASWYANDNFIGTSEERNLVDFIKSKLGNLQQKYSQISLLRNEEVYKIYDFDYGDAFMPDFLLLLQGKEKERKYYQVFIEPKGDNLLESDRWKEAFLAQITERYGLQKFEFLADRKYALIGLPFFNSTIEKMNTFKDDFQQNIC